MTAELLTVEAILTSVAPKLGPADFTVRSGGWYVALLTGGGTLTTTVNLIFKTPPQCKFVALAIP